MWAFRSFLILLPAMVQCNFVDNVRHGDERVLHEEIILNSDMIADMAASPQFAERYISASEMDIGAGYTIKLEGEEKNLYHNGVKCELETAPGDVISAISQFRGGYTSTRIGATISDNYGLHMSPDKSFQFYKRVTYDSSSDEDEQASATNSTQSDKRAFRCTNKTIGAPKTCGDNVKSGNPVNSAHNCPGKGYECTFPQGPTGNDFGICCYSINTARSCGYEGGYCFLDKVKNSCGTQCIS